MSITPDPRPCQWAKRGVVCGQPYGPDPADPAFARHPHRHLEGSHADTDPDCHTYIPPKEESAMPKTLKVHIGTVDMLTFTPCEDNPGTVDAEVVVRIEGFGEDSRLLGGVGHPAVLARYVSDLFEMTGPERAVVEAAKALVAQWERLEAMAPGFFKAMGAKQNVDLWNAVKALRAAEGK